MCLRDFYCLIQLVLAPLIRAWAGCQAIAVTLTVHDLLPLLLCLLQIPVGSFLQAGAEILHVSCLWEWFLLLGKKAKMAMWLGTHNSTYYFHTNARYNHLSFEQQKFFQKWVVFVLFFGIIGFFRVCVWFSCPRTILLSCSLYQDLLCDEGRAKCVTYHTPFWSS